MKYPFIFLLTVLVLPQLTGCSSINNRATQQYPLSAESLASSNLDHWELSAKLGIRTPQKAQTVSLKWQQFASNYAIKLQGPMGFGTATIDGNQQQATIKQGSKSLTGTPDNLAAELLGVPLSIEALNWWIKGLTSPNHHNAKDKVLQENGTLSSFEQNGWQLQFSGAYKIHPYTLPKKITGRRGELSFKLVITQWDFPNKD
jgi:outer membrane lipoprotein LolB